MNLLNTIAAAFALLSVALLLWQWLAARRFPLHQRVVEPSFAPPVTLLKPLKGRDDTTADSLRSWLDQAYAGPTQILFGVADVNDPACEIARELIQKNPDRDAQLVICGESPGANAKVSTLIQLERYAKYELMLVSDADVRVPPDFLANAVVPLRDEKTGLVNCFYRLANPATLAMQWEAIAINADFWSQVLQAASIKPLDFALGAVIVVRRKALTQAGDFISFANCLADDYQLGHRIAEKGYNVILCPVAVECWEAPVGWRQVWQHQLRWARTIRVCQPVSYFFSILSNATFWPMLWLASELPFLSVKTGQITDYGFFQTSGMGIGIPCGLIVAIAFLLIRIMLAQNLQRRLTPEKNRAARFWFVPIKDLLQVVIWAGAFAGNTVEWRGQRMKFRGDGTLEAEK